MFFKIFKRKLTIKDKIEKDLNSRTSEIVGEYKKIEQAKQDLDKELKLCSGLLENIIKKHEKYCEFNIELGRVSRETN